MSPLANAALLVIDLQAGLLRSDPPPLEAEEILQRINSLMERAHLAKRPVIILQHGEEPDLVKGSPGWRLHPELRREPTDILIEKRYSDSFHETALEVVLRKRAIETLVLTGYATEFCIDSTLRRATSLGFTVVLVRDGHTTSDRANLSARQIKAHHESIWSELSVPRPVRLVDSAEINFA